MFAARSLLLTSAVSVLCAACHYGAVSTTGTAYRSEQYDDPWERAARESGARDLKCDSGPIEVAPLSEGKYPASKYRVDGCGKRAVYHCAPASLTQTCHMVLVSKLEL